MSVEEVRGSNSGNHPSVAFQKSVFVGVTVGGKTGELAVGVGFGDVTSR